MLRIRRADGYGCTLSIEPVMILDSGQIAVVREAVHAPDKFAPKRMRIPQFNRPEAGAPDMRDDDFAGDPVQ